MPCFRPGSFVDNITLSWFKNNDDMSATAALTITQQFATIEVKPHGLQKANVRKTRRPRRF